MNDARKGMLDASVSDLASLYSLSETEIVYRTRQDIAIDLTSNYFKLLSRKVPPLQRYLLTHRYNQLLKLIVEPVPGGLYEALVGMTYIEPYILPRLLLGSERDINVFLARDAASDYMCAYLIGSLNIKRNNAAILYISRNTLGEAYRTATTLGKSSPTSSVLQARLRREYDSNASFNRSINFLITTIKDSGALNYSHARYIDSWAEGTVFTLIKLAYDIARETGIEGAKQQLSFAVMNDKKRLRVVKNDFDYQNVVASKADNYTVPEDFYESFMRKAHGTPFVEPLNIKFAPTVQMLQMWYSHAETPVPHVSSLKDFSELMTARIYKPYNHFGSLNLGHPFEWDDNNQTIIPASPDKELGNRLRMLLMINAVLGYKNQYSLSTTKQDARSFSAIKANRPHEVPAFMDSVIDENIEHFVTSSSDSTRKLLSNLSSLARTVGETTIQDLSQHHNYDFQYFLNALKNYKPDDFKLRLAILQKYYGTRLTSTFLKKSLLIFLDELRYAPKLDEILSGKIRCVILDVDGTITPIEESTGLIVTLLQKGFFVGLLTGRPASFCTSLINTIRSKLDESDAACIQNLICYCANGSRIVTASGIVKTYDFTILQRLKIRYAATKHGLRIVSRRNYRYILQPMRVRTNQNDLLFKQALLTRSLSLPLVGIYLARWGSQQEDSHRSYGALDICSRNRRGALTSIVNWAGVNYHEVVYIADEPELADKDMLDHGISVKGYGSTKTRIILERIARAKRRKHN